METEGKFIDTDSCDMSTAFLRDDDPTTSEAGRIATFKQRRATSESVQLHMMVFLFAFLLGIGAYRLYEKLEEPAMPNDYARVGSFEPSTTYKPLFWWTEYSDKNDTEVDALWDAMNSDHGVIAVDREWALRNHWPESMHWPIDDSKNIYVLEGYHLLHCLTIIRKSFWEAVRERPTNYSQYTYDPSHAGHCLDAIRQHIICDANPTPLYSFMETTLGDKQPRQCRDWNSLRDFATQNSACFKALSPHDTDLPPLREAFQHCPATSDDGVIVDAERRGNWD